MPHAHPLRRGGRSRKPALSEFALGERVEWGPAFVFRRLHPPQETGAPCPDFGTWDTTNQSMRGHPERSPPQRTKPKDLHLFLSQTGGSRSLQAPQSQPQNNAGCPSPRHVLVFVARVGIPPTQTDRPRIRARRGRSGIHPRPPQPAHPFFLKIKYAAKPRSAPPAHLPCFSADVHPPSRDGCPIVPILGHGIART